MYPIIKLGGVVKTIYMYTDYRQFLKDRYAELKRRRSFSRYFAEADSHHRIF